MGRPLSWGKAARKPFRKEGIKRALGAFVGRVVKLLTSGWGM